MPRTILHADLDAFYASVEQRDDPSLRGRPVVVGGDLRRGVVSAASYEARRFGVRSAMPMGQALKLCPKAVVIFPRMRHYAAVSHDFFGILERYSPLVEAISLDEAFLDTSGEERLFGDGEAIARRIKAEVRSELGLVVSVGVAASKFVAKIASDLRKPDGLVVVPAGGEEAFLAPLPIGRLWGVGKVTERELLAIGLRTVGDVARVGLEVLRPRLGAEGAAHFVALARGQDDRPVSPEHAPVSVGAEETFGADLREREAIGRELLAQVDRACARMRRLGLRARTITVKIKYADHNAPGADRPYDLITRRATLDHPTADQRTVGEEALRLLRVVPSIEARGVRLAGVSLSGLERRDGVRQLRLDEATLERGEALGDALDRIAARFGRGSVRRAVHLDPGDAAHSDGGDGGDDGGDSDE